MMRLYRPTLYKPVVTQEFGPTTLESEPPYKAWPHFHRGVDYAVPQGTTLFASGDGTVVFAGWDNTGYGNTVVIDHGLGVRSRAAHLHSYSVTVGQRVSAFTSIGQSGSTGNSTGPHVHWELTTNGDPFHPYLLVVERGQ